MNKNVCHVVRKLLPHTETFVSNQILNHQEYNPICIYSEPVESILMKEVTSKIKVFKILDGPFNTLYYKSLKQLTRNNLNYCLDVIKENNAAIVHGHFGPDYWVFRNVIKLAKIPSVVSFYGYDASGFYKEKLGFGKIILKQVFNSANLCLVMSEDMANDLVQLGCPSEKIKKHYFGSSIDEFLNIRHVETGKTIFLTIASLFPSKGHKVILKAIAYLLKKGKINSEQIEFRFIGDGPLFSLLKEFVKESGLDDFVKFLGTMEYKSEKYINHLSEADVFLHPSLTDSNSYKEGIPTSITEAMASGLPIISTYHAGIPSIVRNDIDGILVPENDHILLSEAILKMINNDQFRNSCAMSARGNARINLDIKVRMIDLEKIYSSLI